jgi:DnaJ-class molecular chaperone
VSDDPLKAPKRVRCPICKGVGQHVEHALTVRRCMTCEGRGKILADDLKTRIAMAALHPGSAKQFLG